VRLCKLAAESEPSRTAALRLLAEIYSASGRPGDAIPICRQLVEVAPGDASNLRRLATLLGQWGDVPAAISLLERSLEIDPDNPRGLNNLGKLLIGQGRAAESIPVLQRALANQPAYPIALNNLGLAFASLGRQVEALASFDRAIELQPTFAKAHAGRGLALAAAGRGEEAISAYLRATQLDPRDSAVFMEIGRLMLRLGRWDNAHAAFAAALQLRPDDVLALEGRTMTLIALNRHEEALSGLELLATLKPGTDYLQGTILHARLNCCDWSGLDGQSAGIVARVRRGEPADAPLSFMAHCDSPDDQRVCAEIYARDRCAIAHAKLARERRPTSSRSGPRLRIGYLSADFRNHALPQLLAGVLEAHDRSQVETFAFSAGPGDGSPLRQRLESALEHWVEVGALRDAAIAERMRELAIDIAVDLGGYTTGNRTRVLAYRPAPVQIAFLGFPGTLGADFIDYIVADRHVIPDHERGHYAEHVIYMPDSYLPSDFAAPIGAPPRRAAAGLPAAGTVFCCFNAPYKITSGMFDVWMRILDAVPDSVLWMRDCGETVKSNLSREAGRRAVDPLRLRYAPRMPALADHHARLSLADLFLDSYPYNAHTTACDALIAGVPIITLRGRSFASRVATSLLHTVHLGQLSVDNPESYTRLAIDLGRAPGEIARLKNQLFAVRATTPLFDPRRYCRHLEAAYFESLRRHRQGEGASVLRIERLC
jgi:predicted O-linked N-acetylglucosamine transferase (SPINDLY family)